MGQLCADSVVLRMSFRLAPACGTTLRYAISAQWISHLLNQAVCQELGQGAVASGAHSLKLGDQPLHHQKMIAEAVVMKLRYITQHTTMQAFFDEITPQCHNKLDEAPV